MSNAHKTIGAGAAVGKSAVINVPRSHRQSLRIEPNNADDSQELYEIDVARSNGLGAEEDLQVVKVYSCGW